MTALVRNFGAAVRAQREAHAWSQEQLAEHAGLNRSYVGEIERGTAIASIVTVELARAFGAHLDVAGRAAHRFQRACSRRIAVRPHLRQPSDFHRPWPAGGVASVLRGRVAPCRSTGR
jgi:transcriptional regulator with XRE-family HTH domain